GGTGTVTSSVPGAVTLTVDANGDSGTFVGVIQNGKGVASLVVNGAGTVETLGGANTYTGTTTVTAATLVVGSNNTIPGTSDVTDKGTLDLDGHSDTLAALAGTGTVTSSVAGAVTLTVGASGGSGVFSGTLSDGSGTLTLSKLGAGKQTITGTSDSYTG